MSDEKSIMKSLDEARSYWYSLIHNISQSRKDPRVTIILIQVMIEFYVDEIIKYRFDTDVLKKIRYETKIKLLKDKKCLSPEQCSDLLTIDKMRNLYAHNINIDENKVNEYLKSIKSIIAGSKQEPITQFVTISEFMLKILGYAHKQILTENYRPNIK